MKTGKSVSKFLFILKSFLFIVLFSAASNSFAGYYFVYTSIPDEPCHDDFYQPRVSRHHHIAHPIKKHSVSHHSRSSYHISVYYPIPPCAEHRGCNTCHHYSGYQKQNHIIYQSDPEDAFGSGETYEPINETSNDTCTADDTE